MSPTSAGTAVREVPVVATTTVEHQPYRGQPCGAGFAFTSPDGVLTVVDERLRTVRQGDLGGQATDLSVHGDSWAWIVAEQLWIGGFPGTGAVAAPLLGEAACRWTPDGQALWVANGTGDEVRVELRTPDNRITRTVIVPDEFGGSMVLVCEHPRADAVVLWVAAGQDGQQSWLVRDDGTALSAEQLPADDCAPALFGPDGTWLLAVDDYGITRRSWPGGAVLGELSWDDIDPEAAEDDTDSPGYDVVFLPGGFVSWSTGNGRVRTIDLTTMSVADEIALAGHPVRPVSELHPTLANDHSPGSDFQYSVLGTGGRVLSVHEGHTLVLSASRDWSPDPDRVCRL